VNILLVDDDQFVLESIRRFLVAQGIGVTTASNGVEALCCVEQKVPDLILSDIHMPQMDGLTLATVLGDRFPNVPVALMSADGRQDRVVASMQRSGFTYFKKPLKLRKLVEWIAQGGIVAPSGQGFPQTVQ